MDECEKQMKEQCLHIAQVLDGLAEGKWYDSTTGEILDEPLTDEDGDVDYGRCQDLYDYVMDNLGMKVLTDLQKETVYGVVITFAWGGPGIYADTADGQVKGRWWGSSVDVPLLPETCDAINEIVEEYWAL